MKRSAEITRETRETKIFCRVNLDGHGESRVETPIGFFSHMLETFSRHSLIDLELSLKGDLHVDQHHSVEDTGLVIGQAVREALGEARGVRRNGFCLYPMDETLVRAALDLSGRAGFFYTASFRERFIGEMESALVREFFQALVSRLFATCHLEALKGGNDHHVAEALFKAFAKALSEALSLDPRLEGRVPSTKGTLST
jgi:imidazoleglycerol-phosphate dehydratase